MSPKDLKHAVKVREKILSLVMGSQSAMPTGEIVEEQIAEALADERRRNAQMIQGTDGMGDNCPDWTKMGCDHEHAGDCLAELILRGGESS